MYARRTGLLEYAASNKYIMIFPQVNDPSANRDENCWSSATNNDGNSAQFEVIKKMVDDLVIGHFFHPDNQNNNNQELFIQ